MVSVDRATEGQELIRSESQILFCPMETQAKKFCDMWWWFSPH